MNRKMRVWDKQGKRMITDTQEFIPLIITNKGILRLSAEHKGSLYTLIPFGDRFIPMEETGLKDDNERDIYKNDLVMILDPIALKKENPKRKAWEGPYKVIWDNKQSMYLTEDSKGEIEEMRKYQIYHIVGNIFENKELLK